MAYPALLLISVLLIMCLPFLPAVHEWLRPSDVAPLPVRRNEINNLRYFADSFRLTIAAMAAIDLPETAKHPDRPHRQHQRQAARGSPADRCR